jgi:hypothetical protein
MSSKVASPPYTLIQQTAVVAKVTSAPTDIFHRDNIGYIVSWANGSGTPMGQFFVAAQNQPTDPWVPLDFGTAMTVAGNSGTDLIDINECPFKSLQFSYVPTQGQIDLTVTIVTKKIGG